MKSNARFALRGLVASVILLAGIALASVEFVGVDSKAKLISNDTAVIVTGSLVCSSGESYSVSAVVQQLHGKTSVAASSLDSPDTACTGAPQTFSTVSTVVSPPNETLKKGPAKSDPRRQH